MANKNHTVILFLLSSIIILFLFNSTKKRDDELKIMQAGSKMHRWPNS